MSDENDDIEEEDAEGEEGKKKGLPKIVLFAFLIVRLFDCLIV